MKVLYSWLKDHVDIDLSAEEIAEKLNLSGTAVEGIVKQIDPQVIVAQIKKIEPHPNADRLQVAQVFTGLEELQIVCGAPNIKENQKVPLAQIGTKLEDFEIKRAEIRGVESFGMMCSDRELGLSDDYAGIKILPDDWEVGKSLNEYLTGDSVLEIEITPNRGDCLSHLGVAREISVITGNKLKKPETIEFSAGDNLNLKIENKELYPNYVAIQIENVKIGESPEWLKSRLLAMGAKPINNVVDLTNYIMLDLGQPLHAFDANKVVGGIIVREARQNESIETLDGVERKLTQKNLVIADHEKPIAIAGVMGGKNSEVDDQTNSIILEAAEFKPSSIRATSKMLNLSTEASYRFERGIDSSLVEYAAKKAASLIQDICGGKVVAIEKITTENEPIAIEVEYEKINNLLGLDLDSSQVDNILLSLGFEKAGKSVLVPSWRNDVSLWQDLTEEVGRIYGFDKIKHLSVETEKLLNNKTYFNKEIIKNLLIEEGLTETINYIFMSEQDIRIAGISSSDLPEVKNPIQKENKYLRNSLIPGLIKNAAKNPAFEPIAIFEIGKVFSEKSETSMLAILVAGKNAKSLIDSIKDKLKLESEITKISEEILGRFKIRKSQVFALELSIDKAIKNMGEPDLGQALEAPVQSFYYKKISKYPPLTRDFAFILPDSVLSSEIEETVFETSDKVLLVEIFDEFSSTNFGQNKKSVAFHVYFQDTKKALDEDEANQLSKNVIDNLTSKFDAKLRD